MLAKTSSIVFFGFAAFAFAFWAYTWLGESLTIFMALMMCMSVSCTLMAQGLKRRVDLFKSRSHGETK